MKLLVIDSASIFLQLKHKRKYFCTLKIHQKGQLAFKGLLYKHTNLL
jgi:hypothetical protein